MKKWLATAKPDNRGESLRALQEVSKQRITTVADQYFTNLWRVGGSQGRGAPSIEYRDRQKAKEACVKTFVEKYDTVTAPSGEGQAVRKEMTVQVEQWWNSSDVAASLREENAWGADDTVAVVGKRKKCVPAGGSAATNSAARRADIATGRLPARARRDCQVWVQRPVPRSTPPLVFSHLGQERPAHWLAQFCSAQEKYSSM